MAARKRMEQVKTAILSLLLDAYQRRDKVGLVTFRGDRRRAGAAADALGRRSPPPASSELPAGGRTPLAEGLLEAARVLELERVRDPRRRPLLVVVTDGRATSGADAVDRVAPGRRPPGRAAASPPWSSTASPGRCGWAWPARWPRTCAPSTCRSPRSAPTALTGAVHERVA